MTITAIDWNGRPDDTARFCHEAKLAGESDEASARWRQTVSIIGGTDNLSDAFARTCWDIAMNVDCSRIMERLPRILKIDDTMLPANTLDVDLWKISHGLIKYILRAVELNKLFSIDGLNIVEIGGGWGGLAAVVCTMFAPSSYTIYDLPDVVEGQKRALTRLDFPNVKFGTDWNTQTGDLLISDWAFSELTQDAQEEYGQQFRQFPNGALMCQVFHYSKLTVPSLMLAKLERWSQKPVDWGPYCQHYIEAAFRHGDPRLQDAFIWRTM